MPLTTDTIFPPPSDVFQKFPSRRSVVHSTKGIVACSQPLAAKCGIEILQKGGNAADAAVAVAAGLNMTEPCSTGIGGDMFCLFYDAKTKKVSALNGSGRSGNQYTLDRIRTSLGLSVDKQSFADKIPMDSVHAVTVPGAAAGWVDTVERFGSGKLSIGEILAPAIALGENGYPVSELTAYFWQRSEHLLRKASPNFAEWLKKDPSAKPDGLRAPRAGEIMRNPTLAKTFRALATEGKKGFYTGRIAEALVKVVQDLGGHLDLSDLQHHLETGSEPVDPISFKWKDSVEVWEHPPNGQGIVALIALGIIQALQEDGTVPQFGPDDITTAPYLHVVIEALRLGFADASWWVTDPNEAPVPVKGLLSKEYLAERAKLFDPKKANTTPGFKHGTPGGPPFPKFPSPALQSSDTVYFCVADGEGNAISFINSNYGGFGTSIIPQGCGFTLQNRGANFSLDARHPNVVKPRKRPYHTIIPGLVTNQSDNSLYSVFGVMGGFMQPQGHVQTLLGQLIGGLSPQQALDTPRICIGSGKPEESGDVFAYTVDVEEGLPEETIEGLRKLGHPIEVVKDKARAVFGRGQIIRYTVDPVDKVAVWSAGSDQRGDGAAYPL